MSASVGVWIKQLEQRLAVARRHVRRLHMAGKGTSQQAGSEQAEAAVTRGHSEPEAAYVMEQSSCSVDITGKVGIINMRVEGKLDLLRCM